MVTLRWYHTATGYLVLAIARRVARKKVAGLTSPARARTAVSTPAKGLGSRLVSNTTHAGGAMAGWFQANGSGTAAALAPYAIAAARDPEVQLSLGRAATAGKGAYERVSSLNPRDALHAAAYDSKLHDRLGESVKELDSAINAIGLKPRKRKSVFKRLLMLVGLITVVGGVVLCLKHFLGGDDDEFVPEIDSTSAEPTGADIPA